MAKKKTELTQTEMATGEGAATRLSATLTVDDSAMPSPEELRAYQSVSPDIVKFFIDASLKEQAHRHRVNEGRLKVLSRESRREERINLWGMFFAFLLVLALVGLTAFAIWLDRPWMATASGLGTFAALISIFVRPSVPTGAGSRTERSKTSR